MDCAYCNGDFCMVGRVDNESPKGFDFDWQCKLMKAFEGFVGTPTRREWVLN